jgi:hypothetical protein
MDSTSDEDKASSNATPLTNIAPGGKLNKVGFIYGILGSPYGW